MTPTPTPEELRRLALECVRVAKTVEAAGDLDCVTFEEATAFWNANNAFYSAATPAAILSLLDKLQEMEKALTDIRARCDEAITGPNASRFVAVRQFIDGVAYACDKARAALDPLPQENQQGGKK